MCVTQPRPPARIPFDEVCPRCRRQPRPRGSGMCDACHQRAMAEAHDPQRGDCELPPTRASPFTGLRVLESDLTGSVRNGNVAKALLDEWLEKFEF